MERKFKFKAWNKKEQLLVRLNSIDCKKGELYKKDHILLQYTGLKDKNKAELYENDIVLLESVKYMILWDTDSKQWAMISENNTKNKQHLIEDRLLKSIRLCNYYESPAGFEV